MDLFDPKAHYFMITDIFTSDLTAGFMEQTNQTAGTVVGSES